MNVSLSRHCAVFTGKLSSLDDARRLASFWLGQAIEDLTAADSGVAGVLLSAPSRTVRLLTRERNVPIYAVIPYLASTVVNRYEVWTGATVNVLQFAHARPNHVTVEGLTWSLLCTVFVDRLRALVIAHPDVPQYDLALSHMLAIEALASQLPE